MTRTAPTQAAERPNPELAAAQVLWARWQAGTKLADLPAALRPRTRAAGYAVQAALPAASGRAVLGWKIAATSAAGQAHIGVDGPLAGRLLSGQVYSEGVELSLVGNSMRVVEPEFAFRFRAALPPRSGAYGLNEVLAAVATLHPALEVPDSRFTDFARAGEARLLADDACAHQLVLGAAAPELWRLIDLPLHTVQAQVHGTEGCRLARVGQGSNVLGDPREALCWLVNELNQQGIGIEPDQFVSTGTCCEPLPVRAGDAVTASYGVLGRVSVRFAKAAGRNRG